MLVGQRRIALRRGNVVLYIIGFGGGRRDFIRRRRLSGGLRHRHLRAGHALALQTVFHVVGGGGQRIVAREHGERTQQTVARAHERIAAKERIGQEGFEIGHELA